MLAGIFIITGSRMATARAVLLDIHQLQNLRAVEALGAKRGWNPERYLSAIFGEPVEYAWRGTEAVLTHLVGLDAATFNVPHHESVQALAALMLLGEPIPGDDSSPGDGGGSTADLVPEPPRSPPGAVPDVLRFT